ncbi:1-deoxy-D-xylulose-5-phosphate synthase N-terminal domain-containing protein [Candidatus Omnitrophota bacterium]
MRLDPEQKNIRRRIIEISHRYRLSHLGSCLSACDIIYAIYKIKRKEESFVLSCGHSAIALYAVLEKFGWIKRAQIKNLHVHPDRDPRLKIAVSTGSLGQGLPIALGMALANPKRNVYCLVSDGECSEGSIWEALRIAREQRVCNLKIIINANGWAAYRAVSIPSLIRRLEGFGYKVLAVDGNDLKGLSRSLRIKTAGRPLLILGRTKVGQLPFLKGQDAHYYVMNDKDCTLALEILK